MADADNAAKFGAELKVSTLIASSAQKQKANLSAGRFQTGACLGKLPA